MIGLGLEEWKGKGDKVKDEEGQDDRIIQQPG